jgi:dienelactone hydrolase
MKEAGRKCASVLAGILLPMFAATVAGQTTEANLRSLLAQPVEPAPTSAFQLEQYLSHRIPPLPSPKDASDWTEQEQRLRKHVLEDIAFHGWPSEWVQSAPKFQPMGVIESGNGYRVRKFRYEIVPGFLATALLYEPEKMDGRVPAILNVIGHERMGNAAEYEQKRCINFAKRGIIALSLEWIGFGEMALKGDAHDDAASLDLVGSNALGFHYLAMRRGLDYLATLPQVDTTRIGMTGLSSGGWQTILLSSTDPRIAVAVEVAGFGALPSNITHPGDTSELEEDTTDLAQGEDYPFFVAMRAPRPTLLIHNAEDDCCFRAALVKPYIYEQVRPFFDLYGKVANLGWYENIDPGTHNYQLSNRLQAYSFFQEHFHLPTVPDEIPSSTEVRTPEELSVGIPADNLTLVGLAKKLSSMTIRPAAPAESDVRAAWIASQRGKLKQVTRYTPVSVTNAWRFGNTRGMAIRTVSYRFDLANGLSASGVWLQADGATDNAPVTIVLNDKGYAAAGKVVAEHVNRGERVLALDLVFTGSAHPEGPRLAVWELLVATVGDRPLGLEAAQLVAVANWLRTNSGGQPVQVETDGIRTAVIAAVAAAIEPAAFSAVTSNHGMKSMDYLLNTPDLYRSAPDLFCLDLYKYFDIDSIGAIAAPTKIKNLEPVEENPQRSTEQARETNP